MNVSQNKVFWPEREKIFSAARALLEQGRFRDASLGEIAYYAKLSETTLRVFFKSKHEILRELSSEHTALRV